MGSARKGLKKVTPPVGSQSFSRPSGRITGMRSCTGRIMSLASVVRIANVTGDFSSARVDAGEANMAKPKRNRLTTKRLLL